MPAKLLLIVAILLPLSAEQARAQASEDPNQLFANREDLSSAQRAAAMWEAQATADRTNYEAAWKLARVCYWLGGHVTASERESQYKRGIEIARQAIALSGMKPEGHFWLAANMGAMAESFGLRAGLRYRGPIKDELETVLRLDPAFQQGSADRALGRWYFKVPGLFGGSRDRALEHLNRSLQYNANSTATRFFLAEVFVEMKRHDDARRELNAVLDAPLDPEWTPEDKEFKAKAAALLKTLPAPKR